MGIEQDIEQTSFNSEYHKALINLIYTHSFVSEKLKQIFDREEITAQQFNILRILRGAGRPISNLQIRKKMLVKMSDTSRMVDRLLLKGLVEKTSCPSDRRLVDISISYKGLKLLKHLDAYAEEMDELLNVLSKTEVRELNRILEKIREKK